MVVITFWAFCCLFNAIHGSKNWLQYSIATTPLVNYVNNQISNQGLKTNSYKSAEYFTNNNYFIRLTPLENAGNKEVTNPTITDITTYGYRNLVLTTAIKLRQKKITADLNIPQNDITEYFKKTISEPKNIEKKYQVSQPFKNSRNSITDRKYTGSESDSLETTTDGNQYKVHTPARRIFYGHKTKIKHFPFLVTVHVLGRFICGGTIIKSNLVITAAACITKWLEWSRTTTTQKTSAEPTTDTTTTDTTTGNTMTTTDVTTTAVNKKKYDSSEDPGKSSSYETVPPPTTEEPVETPKVDIPDGALSVRVGTNYYRLEGKVVHVVNVTIHPEYDDRNLRNNLVIMKLQRHLNLTRRRVRKIGISKAIDVPENTDVTIAGWGAKTYHNKVFNALWNLIHKSVMTVSPLYQCARRYPSKVTTANFCALNEQHEGACNRDEGNPAVADGLLVGIVSFGPPQCGAWDSPTVFTNIGYYAEWIKGVMRTMDPSSIESSSSLENIPSTPTTVIETTNTERNMQDKIETKEEEYIMQIFPEVFPFWGEKRGRIYQIVNSTY